MTQTELEKLKLDLTQELAVIEAELGTFTHKSPVVKGDYLTRFPKNEQTDTLDEKAHSVEEYEKDREVEHSLELRLKDIKETLSKIESGTYGVCNRCQNPIEERRLKAMAVARFCLDCAKLTKLV